MKLLFKILLLVLLLCSISGYSQWYLEPSLVIPTGDNAYILKPGLCVGLGIKVGKEDSYYRFGVLFQYGALKPTEDTFRIYGIGGSPVVLAPGYEVVHKYELLSFGITNDGYLFPDKKLTPFLGFDINFNVETISESYSTEGQFSGSTTGDNYWLVSIAPRLGVRYKLNDMFAFEGGCLRSISLTGTANPLAYWNPFFTFCFTPGS